MLRIYLAGPDVFRPAAKAIGQRKQEMCAAAGTLGVFPLDTELDLSGYARGQDKGYAIAIANETLMRGCDAIIANLTPYRGASADAGTAFELGFMRALGKPCFAYSNSAVNFYDRVSVTHKPSVAEDGWHRDGDGNALENFDLVDNLMLDGAVNASTGGKGTITTVAATDPACFSGFQAVLDSEVFKAFVTQKKV